MKKEVLGIKIDDVNMEQAVEIVLSWLKKTSRRYIVTPNPEIVVMAQKDKKLKDIINHADLAIPDGIGLKLTTGITQYTTGVDLMEELVRRSIDYRFTVGLLGGRIGVAEKCAECLQRKYPKLKITFVSDGGEVDKEGNILRLRPNNNIPPTDLLFVAFGPPKQEKWIDNNLNKLPVKVAMVVGGSFDYLSGMLPRAPFWIRNLGFEWLFRLFTQPWRIKRQIALIKYLLMVL